MPGQPVVLEELGGIVATSRPEDLPEGASPRAYDVDFNVGRFIQRAGLQEALPRVPTQYGPEAGTVAADIDTEGMPWTNPSNILAQDGSSATINLLGTVQVLSVSITQGGFYALSETPVIGFTGPGAGGATATVGTTTSGSYKYVSSVTITLPGSYTGPVTCTFTGAASPTNDATGTVVTGPLGQTSDNIRVTGFTFTIPSTYQINGIGLTFRGSASNAQVYAQMVKAGSLVGAPNHVTLPTSTGNVSMGNSGDLWGTTWDFTDIDSPNFGIELWVTSPAVTSPALDSIKISIYGTPQNANFNGLMDANLLSQTQVTLALDANGVTWEEDVTNAPDEMFIQSLVPTVPAGARMVGLDANGVAYMTYSDLTQGISQPMQFNGSWCDRITQVGPGASPQFTPSSSTTDVFNLVSITQPPVAMDPFGNPFYGFIYFLQSSGPGSTAPGNIVTIYYGDSTTPGAQNTDLVTAFNSGNPTYIYLSVTGTPTTFGPYTQLVTSVGEAQPPGQPRNFFYFCYQVPSVAFTYYQGSGHPGYEVAWQRTLATITTVNPVPGLTIGSDITVAGVTPAAWNSTWTITQSLDSSAMAITQTSVTGGVATYNYTLSAGSVAAPAAGQLVTITGTTNANGTLNLTNATISSATGGSTGSFTINVAGPNFAATAETGQATTAGDIFAFDPGAAVVGTATNPIFGDSTVVGTLTFINNAGTFITPGTRQGTVFFITRNGAVTCVGPPVTFTCPTNTAAIIAANIPIGPPNVVARGIAFTEAGQEGVAGANFYTFSTPVQFTVAGTMYTASPLILNDNTTTSATFTFSDAVLLSADEIDIEGNNYFNLREIGSPAWIFQYANRMMYGLCQSKLDNLLNPTFDGGYLPTGSTNLPLPLGWSAGSTDGNNATYTITAFQITSNVVTFTAVNSLQAGYTVAINGLSIGTYLNGALLVVQSATGTHFTAAFTHSNVGLTADSGTADVFDSPFGLVESLDFGNAFRITNFGDTTWTSTPILWQSAYQDVYGVNIINPNIPYSIRVKARAINADSQTVSIKLLTYASGVFGATDFGSASFTFDQGNYQIKTGTLVLSPGITTVPSTLQLTVNATLSVGAGVEIDRIEVFETNNPIDTVTIWESYAGNFEAVDRVTGQLGAGAENPQPATGAFQILEQLYITKTKSLLVTQDSPNYEPNNWQVRQASDGMGAIGPLAFCEGEEFTVSAARNGIYYFDGGKPMPISNELQSNGFQLNLWETINWAAGNTIWVQNDLTNRRLLVGLPMNTPNFWLPNDSPATPTSPNVILMCNYTGCPTGPELAEASEVHVTMFGDMKAIDMRRKWALWRIPSPVAQFIKRSDKATDELFICNGIGSGKIYQLADGAPSGGQNTDDGAPINWLYTTYGFVKAKQGQQLPGIGAMRKIAYYLTATMEGVGKVACKLYSNSLGALPRNTFTIPLQFTLSYPQQNDQERPLEIGGQRIFVEFKSVGSGGYAEIGPLTLDMEVDKNSPRRGVAS